MIIGTAGHIDHGKSALIQALTGRAMDRLAEERRRGITIDLNFAPLDLGDGRIAGIVDVPGHEDFVRNMVAGASGIDLVLLVIAADEGIMPQTREHLAIVEQLGVHAGIPVITKRDLVEDDWIDMVALEAAEWLERSPIQFGPPVAVSALRGAGIDELRERIVRELAALPPRPVADLFRLPADRVFSVAGVGTVVTGTITSGTVSIGDLVRIMPSAREGRVRSIEVHGAKVERSEAGRRTAVGLAGVERQEVERGDTLVGADDSWAPTTALDVELRLLSGAPRALSARARVRIHLGTTEVLARVHPRAPIAPGQAGLARLALESPLSARGGDRFVVRSYSPATSIGGGTVLDPLPPRRGSSWNPELASADPAVRLSELLLRRPNGLSPAELPILLGVPAPAAEQMLRARRGVRLVGDRWIASTRVTETGTRALEIVRAWQAAHPSEPGLPLETLRAGLRVPAAIIDAVIGEESKTGRLVVMESVIRTPDFRPRVASGDEGVRRLVEVLARAGLNPPSVGELESSIGGSEIGAALRLAARDGRVVAVERDRYYAAAPLEQFVEALRALGATEPITPGALRDRLGLSRKFLIPLLEWADARGVTERVGDARRLKGSFKP
jgi:selenocysteine-specific elongation factor